ncbi:hypothetical protein Scep_024774 [Stephania cephalantha]|uniref:Uncharacterized protein n=1 Tax=Stephania cephalantha TaxID=152367 RepID=A0AAP0EXX1_9MAGN
MHIINVNNLCINLQPIWWKPSKRIPCISVKATKCIIGVNIHVSDEKVSQNESQ